MKTPKQIWDVLYQYKIDKGIQKVLGPFMKKKPLQDMILIESHNDFDCNGGAFYRYLIENSYNKNYKIVLFLKNALPDPKTLPANVQAVPMLKPSLKKDKAYFQAKYMLSDAIFLRKTRPDQVSVYCTHGSIGLKNCKGMMDLPEGIDYCLGSSPAMADIFADQYNLPHPDKQLIYVGYPMHDVLHDDMPGDLSKITSKKFFKTILWMPTFRKGGAAGRNDSGHEQPLGIPLIESQQEYEALNDMLADMDMHLILKIHPMQDLENLHAKNMSNITVLTGQDVKKLGVDNYRLMKDADALISDYSSAAYDYLQTGRPVAYTLDDAEDYKIGFIVEDPYTLMAGHEIYTLQDMKNFLQDMHDGKDPYKEKRKALTEKLFSYNDAYSSRRLADFLGLKKPE